MSTQRIIKYIRNISCSLLRCFSFLFFLGLRFAWWCCKNVIYKICVNVNNSIKFYAICIYYVITMNKRPMGRIAQLSNKQGMAMWFRRKWWNMFYLCKLSRVLPHYYWKKYDLSDSPVILYTLVYFHTIAPFDYTINFLWFDQTVI